MQEPLVKKTQRRRPVRHTGMGKNGGVSKAYWLLRLGASTKSSAEAAAVGVFHQQHPIRLKNLLFGFAGVQEPLVEKTQRRRFRRRMIFSPSQECRSRWSKRHNGGVSKAYWLLRLGASTKSSAEAAAVGVFHQQHPILISC